MIPNLKTNFDFDLTLKNIITNSRADVLEAKKILDYAIYNNTDNFLNAIKNNNSKDLIKHYDWGLPWDTMDFWKTIRMNLHFSNANLETMNTLWNIQPPIGVNKDQKTGEYFHDLSPRENWEKNLSAKINNYLQYQQFNPDLFEWVKENKPEILKNELTLTCLIKHLTESSLNLPEQTSFQEYILYNAPDLSFKFLELSQNEEQVNFFLYQSVLKHHFNQLLNKENDDEKRQLAMSQALAQGNLSKIIFWENFGVPFPTNKEAYSHLFANIKNKAAIEYVAKKLPDITVGNQVILRTILHQEKQELHDLIPMILDCYTPEQLEQLPLALKGRTQTDSVLFIQKLYDTSQLVKKLNDTLPENFKQFSKNKI
jgi:hypothetical protein